MSAKFALPKGVSGFFEPGTPLPAAPDPAPFWAVCQQIGALPGWELIRQVDHRPHPDFTYHLAVFAQREAHYLLFCHKQFWLLGISRVAEPIDATTYPFESRLPVNTYTDLPEWDGLLAPPFHLLPAAYLSITTDADDMEDAGTVRQLDFIEFAEFSYYEPKILGDIVFNSWRKKR